MRRKRKREGRGGEQTRERARREQTLMPPCRPQMLHQLQTSSFLPQPVLSFHQVSANREGETRRTYAVFKLTTSRRVRCSSPLPPTLILFRRLIFSLSLSLSFRSRSLSRGDDIGLYVAERKTRKGEGKRHGRHGRQWSNKTRIFD